MSLFLKKLSEEFEIPESDAKEVWEDSVSELEQDTGKERTSFSSEDFKECERRTRVVLESESLIKVADFFDSGMDASQFLETLVSGNFNISNVVNRKKDMYFSEEEDSDEDLEEVEDDEVFDEEEEELVDESDEDAYIEEEESEVAPDIMTESEARQLLGAASGTSVSGSIPKCLQ